MTEPTGGIQPKPSVFIRGSLNHWYGFLPVWAASALQAVIDNMGGDAWHVGVRVTKVPETGAKRTMLDAAERLVAVKGFDSVSIRDVTGAAKANVAAVNYHFGSREGLLALVMTHILEPLCAERIAQLEAAGKQVSVGESVAAFVNALPPAAARIGMDGSLFFRLAGRILSLPHEALPVAMEDASREVTRRFLAALAKALPHTPAKELAADWAFFEAGIAQSLVVEADAKNITALMARWNTFGVRGLGETFSKKKNDPQGMLFEL